MRVINCPNPECHRKIEEPILLDDMSTIGGRYYACPHCLTKLNAYACMRARTNLAGLFLTAFGSIILALVGCLTWYEMALWGKDIALVFFGSRTGEAISLGIGMKVIYYSLIGLALIILGLGTFLRRRSEIIELHLDATAPEKEKGPPKCFGYLEEPDQNTPIPSKCLKCSRILECSGFIE